jgi:hypothetical protein
MSGAWRHYQTDGENIQPNYDAIMFQTVSLCYFSIPTIMHKILLTVKTWMPVVQNLNSRFVYFYLSKFTPLQ